jgi:hypothetical protein
MFPPRWSWTLFFPVSRVVADPLARLSAEGEEGGGGVVVARVMERPNVREGKGGEGKEGFCAFRKRDDGDGDGMSLAVERVWVWREVDVDGGRGARTGEEGGRRGAGERVVVNGWAGRVGVERGWVGKDEGFSGCFCWGVDGSGRWDDEGWGSVFM